MIHVGLGLVHGGKVELKLAGRRAGGVWCLLRTGGAYVARTGCCCNVCLSCLLIYSIPFSCATRV